MKDKPIIALIGQGRWGSILLKELEKQSTVKYVCKSNMETDQALADAKVEAVFIATPTDSHYGIAKACLMNGKHVFLEKPGTTSGRLLEELYNLAQLHNLKLSIGYEFVHHPAAKRIKELISDGNILSIHLEWHKWGSFHDHLIPHLLCHEISLLESWGINTEPASCSVGAGITPADIAHILFDNNVTSYINRVSPYKEKVITIFLKSGKGYIWRNDTLYEIEKDNLELIEIPLTPDTAVSLEISHFLACIEDNIEPETSGAFGVRVYDSINKAIELAS